MTQLLRNMFIAMIIVAIVVQIDTSKQQDMIKYPVTYGSLIKIYSESSNRYLHSHEIKFGRGGIYSVTGVTFDDQGNYWQVLEQYPHSTKTYDMPLKCGDIIRLRSAIINYNIRTDQTSFGLTTQLLPMVHGVFDSQADQAINWKIKCISSENNHKEVGDTIYFGDIIQFKHSVTGKYIIMDPSSQYTEFNCRGCEIIRQVEIHAVDGVQEEQKTAFKILGGLGWNKNNNDQKKQQTQ